MLSKKHSVHFKCRNWSSVIRKETFGGLGNKAGIRGR